MSHTYADLQAFKRFLIDQDDADAAAWSDSDPTILTLLEGASRRVDTFCDRSDFHSGFGPRIATNRYDMDGSNEVDLRDDFLAFGTIELIASVGGSTATLVIDTDIYARPYSGPPYTSLVFTGLGGAPSSGLRLLSVAGTAGYSDETYPLGTAGTATASATSLTLTAGTAYGGMTLRVDSEQMYVTTSGGTATVVRGVNGTTAAIHAANSTVYAYRYPRDVVTATLMIAQRRQRSAQSGVQGDFGGGSLPIVGHRDSESSILRGTVNGYRKLGVG